jgi:assimilatory nitrate reductase catalytic subunit
LCLDDVHAIRYDDARRGHARRLLIDGDRLVAARLSGDPQSVESGEWLREWMASGESVAAIRRLLLMPAAQPPAAMVRAGRNVCQCFDVSEETICAALATLPGNDRERLTALQARLACGTQCGSCLPQLRECVKRTAPPVVVALTEAEAA